MDSFHEQMEEYSFPYYEQKDIKLMNIIGEGGTGTVYTGTLTILDDTLDCVIKVVNSEEYDKRHRNRFMYQDILDEVDIGRRFMNKSKHQIQFYGYSILERNDIITIYLLMERTNSNQDISTYLGLGEFWNKLTKQEYDNSKSPTKMYHQTSNTIEYWDYTMSVTDKFNLIKQLCISIQDLHKFNVVHCDLKRDNMVYSDNIIKLIDYGASQFMDNEKEIQGSCNLGTAGYMAPEMYDGWISYKSDIYSLGVCILEIWFGDIWPSNTNSYKKCRQYVLNYLSLLKKDNKELHKLVQRCVSTDTKKRPLIKTVLSNLN